MHPVRLAIALLVALNLVLVSSSPAFAGTNGQQLQIIYNTTNTTTCGPMVASRITVSGTNQNLQKVSPPWSATVSNMACGKAQVTTSGWWWRGAVTVVITYTNRGSSVTKTCGFNVPKSWSTDVFTVQCL